MMEGRWRTLPAAFYAAFAQVLNEVYDKVIFLWACGITPLLSTVSKSSAASFLGGRTALKSIKNSSLSSSEQPVNTSFSCLDRYIV